MSVIPFIHETTLVVDSEPYEKANRLNIELQFSKINILLHEPQ